MIRHELHKGSRLRRELATAASFATGLESAASQRQYASPRPLKQPPSRQAFAAGVAKATIFATGSAVAERFAMGFAAAADFAPGFAAATFAAGFAAGLFG